MARFENEHAVYHQLGIICFRECIMVVRKMTHGERVYMKDVEECEIFIRLFESIGGLDPSNMWSGFWEGALEEEITEEETNQLFAGVVTVLKGNL